MPKPMHRALEHNPVRVRYWLQSRYPAIKEQAKAERASVWWGKGKAFAPATVWGEKGTEQTS